MPYGKLALDQIDTSGNLTIAGGLNVQGPINSLAPSTISASTTLTSTNILTNNIFICSGTAADYTITLPTAVNNGGKTITFIMSSALTKLVTLGANGSETIDGALTRIMWARESCTLLSDGTSWYKIAGKTIPIQAGLYKTGGDQAISSGSLTKVTVQTSIATNSPAAVLDTTNSRLIAPRPGIYTVNASVRFKAVTSATSYEAGVYKNGTGYNLMSRYMTSGDWGAMQIVHQIESVVGDYYETWARQYTGSNQTLASGLIENGIYFTEIPQW